MRNKIWEMLKLTRPTTLLWFTVSTCYGFASVILNGAPRWEFGFLVLTIAFANVGAIIVNDMSDVAVDALSTEKTKRFRPFVTGALTIKEGVVLSTVFYVASIAVSFFYGTTATVFSAAVIILSLSYSLPPTKFCARPYGSLLYWVTLCIACFLLMLTALESGTDGSIIYPSRLVRSSSSWLFTVGIVLFMGIAEILAKDLRDKVNDAEGGRNTFVNHFGLEVSVKALIFFAWFGCVLWIEALYLCNVFPSLFFAILCAVVGAFWCWHVYITGLSLVRKYEQQTAAMLHTRWTYVYAAMQLLTFCAFL